MSVEAMAIAFNHSRSTGAARTILLGIASHDGDGGAWPAMERLAIYGGCNVRNAQHAVDKLVKLGEIEIVQNGGGLRSAPDHMRPNLYKFKLRCPPNCDGTKTHWLVCTICAKPLTLPRFKKGTHVKCELSTGVSLATPGVAGDTGGVSHTTPELNLDTPDTDIPVSHLGTHAQARDEDAFGGSLRAAVAIVGYCQNSHPYIAESAGGVAFCHYGCSPLEGA